MLGEKAELVLCHDSRLQLCEQRCDRLEGIELFGHPVAVADLDEAQTARGDVAREHRHDRHRPGDVAGLLDGLLIFVGRRLRAEDQDLFRGLGGGEHGIGVGEVDGADWIGVGDVGAERPLGNQDRRVDVVVVVPQEAEVDTEMADQLGRARAG